MDAKPKVLSIFELPIYTGLESKAKAKIKLGIELSDDDLYTICKDVLKKFDGMELSDDMIHDYLDLKYPGIDHNLIIHGIRCSIK